MSKHLMAEQDSSVFEKKNLNRLGKCEVCSGVAKYTCPKCEVKTCCLECVKIHKEELKCNGIRDRTKYIPLKNMTEEDFMKDYYFLEECTRFSKDIQRCSKQISVHEAKRFAISKMFQLKKAASDRETILKILPQVLLKRRENTSYYNRKTKTIFWRIEWIFSNANGLKLVDKYCCENDTISVLLNKYLNPNCEALSEHVKKKLIFYQSKGLANLRVLLKSEGVRSCKNKFYELDATCTLKKSLNKKIITEFPSVHICYNVENFNYEIIEDVKLNNILVESKMLYDEVRQSLNMQRRWVAKQTKIDHKCKTDEEITEELKKIDEEKLKWKKFENLDISSECGFNFLISSDNDFLGITDLNFKQ
ncbi:box C/D snoRNA protein 1-like isoform X1 [Condylostylus longicornis]|uniref:box C/D snoRNA protein 1-like isoform X1 n=1 Tax=Condylostylus longicornis TaxID=2530218 RepID=UPI00244E48BD|nr:box C/D snoRNA protein 1-like isoform X1 [Condylostylus longicornis]